MRIIKKKLSLNINIDLPLVSNVDNPVENALITNIENLLAQYKKSDQVLNFTIRKKTTTTSKKTLLKHEINEK